MGKNKKISWLLIFIAFFVYMGFSVANISLNPNVWNKKHGDIFCILEPALLVLSLLYRLKG